MSRWARGVRGGFNDLKHIKTTSQQEHAPYWPSRHPSSSADSVPRLSNPYPSLLSCLVNRHDQNHIVCCNQVETPPPKATADKKFEGEWSGPWWKEEGEERLRIHSSKAIRQSVHPLRDINPALN